MFGTGFFGFTNASGSGGSSTITGTISSPQVAFGSGSNTIAGDSTFLFNNDGNKELLANRFHIAVTTLLGTAKDGYFEYDGAQLYFDIGATRYIIGLTPA